VHNLAVSRACGWKSKGFGAAVPRVEMLSYRLLGKEVTGNVRSRGENPATEAERRDVHARRDGNRRLARMWLRLLLRTGRDNSHFLGGRCEGVLRRTTMPAYCSPGPGQIGARYGTVCETARQEGEGFIWE